MPLETPPIPRWLHFLAWLYLPLLMLVVAAFAWRPLDGGDDFWAHAAIGRWIVENGQVPHRTLFLWSADEPYIAHAWLFEVLCYGAMKLGGEGGGPVLTRLFTVGISALPFFLIWRRWRRDQPFSSLVPLVFLAAMWVSSPRFEPRPELFTALFLTILWLFLLDWPRETPSWRRAAPLVLMFALWPNLHGAVAYGIVLLWATVLCDLFQFRRRALPLVAFAALCTLAVVCNPYGVGYWRVLVPINSETFAGINEWKPFWKWPALSAAVVGVEYVLWSAALLLWAVGRERRWAQIAWIFLMGAAFIRARRNLWVTSLACLVVIIANAGALDTQKIWRAWRTWMAQRGGESASAPIPHPMRALVRLTILVLGVMAIADITPKDFWPPRAVSPKLPVKMTEFLATQAPPGRIFNDYEFSAYHEWGLRGRRELFIDLNNAYPDRVMKNYFATLKRSQALKMLDQMRIQVVALRPAKKNEGVGDLGRILDGNASWKRIYRGKDGTIWARV